MQPANVANPVEQSVSHTFTQPGKCALQATQEPSGGGGGDELRVALGRVIKQLAERWRVGALLAAALQLPEAVPLGVDLASVPAAAGSSGSSPLAVALSSAAAASGGDAAAQQHERGCVPAWSVHTGLHCRAGLCLQLLRSLFSKLLRLIKPLGL